MHNRKNNRSDQYYKKRRGDTDWDKPYGNRPKKKYGVNYDSKDYDYQYIHKDRKQYSRQEMIELVPRAIIDNELLEELSIKYDLVFTTDEDGPIGDIENFNLSDRFIEHEYDKEYEKRSNIKDRDSRTQSREHKTISKKEFVKFDEFSESMNDQNYDILDQQLENNYKKNKIQPKEDIPLWVQDDYDVEQPLWSKVDVKDIQKQKTNTILWPDNNINELVKMKDPTQDYLGYDESDDENNNEDEAHYYEYNSKNHNYNFYDDEEEEYKMKEKLDGDNSQNQTELDPTADLTSILMKMKKDEEDEQIFSHHEPEIINADYYQEEFIQKKKEMEEANKFLSIFKSKGPQKEKSDSIKSIPIKSNSLMESLGILDPQKVIGGQKEVYKESNLDKILGQFVMGGINNRSDILNDKKLMSEITNVDDIDIIEGPPPSVIKNEDNIDEKTEQNRKEFQEKYFAMDKALSLLVYDALNSKRRDAINWSSKNGVNQASVEKYCSNKYKIFSFLMQGDIFSQVWSYKDKIGNIQGPFMSFDMDVWNGESKYFSKLLLISPNQKNYYPLSGYLERDPIILDLMQEVAGDQQSSFDQKIKIPNKMIYPPQMGSIPAWNPTQMMNSQVPLIPYPKGKNIFQNKKDHNGKILMHGYIPHTPLGFMQFPPPPAQFINKKEEIPSLITALSSSKPLLINTQKMQENKVNQSEMTQNLKQMLGIFSDPVIHQTPNRLNPTNENQSQKSIKTPVFEESDFPPISKAFQS